MSDQTTVCSTVQKQRTTLQREADAIDLALFNVIYRLERVAESIPVAGPKLRGIANRLHAVRPDIRELMHPSDRKGTEG